MTFAHIARGASAFVDANTLVYHFTADPNYGPACKLLIERIARAEIRGVTSAHVVSDVAHRVMTVEAIAALGWPAKGIAYRLRKNSTDIQRLTRFRQAVQEVPRIGIRIVPVDLPLVEAATVLSQQHGLLTGDALIVAVMQQHGLTGIASLDDDFDRVPGLTRYGPV